MKEPLPGNGPPDRPGDVNDPLPEMAEIAIFASLKVSHNGQFI
jgi:hypothetical protein